MVLDLTCLQRLTELIFNINFCCLSDYLILPIQDYYLITIFISFYYYVKQC